MTARPYTFDAEARIWRTPWHDNLAYSDGDEVEDRLLSILRQTRDVSSTSDELRRHIVDWPSEYHFSSTRHNLMRPFHIGPGDRILELGCGCGAITRYLGETGATVVAVEGSRTRATIAAERCRDLTNVSIVCDNLAAFESADRFDFVTLIGVLEYSPQFLDAEDPVVLCLRKARSHLCDSGTLILAIENRLGLKYLSGCNEDHVGRPFFGVEDLYDASTAITLGRRELLAALESAGFTETRCLYPFPDYKLPSIIVSEAGIAEGRLRVEDLLLRNQSPDRVAAGPRSFSEPLAWSSICRNGLVPDVSNSFLFIAGGSAAKPDDKIRSFLALSFATNRLREYATETEFHLDNAVIMVTKRALVPAQATAPVDVVAHQSRLRLRFGSTTYLQGRMYLGKLMRQCRTGTDFDGIARWAKPWTEMLFAAATFGTGRTGHLLPGDYFDCIPLNLLETADGCLHFIDREWQVDDRIPLSWVFVRGLSYALANCAMPADCKLTVRCITAEVGRRLEVALTDEDFSAVSALEDAIQNVITGSVEGAQHLDQVLNQPARAVLPIFAAYRHSLDCNAELQATLAAMTNSRSWRVTAPLRFLNDLAVRARVALTSRLAR